MMEDTLLNYEPLLQFEGGQIESGEKPADDFDASGLIVPKETLSDGKRLRVEMAQDLLLVQQCHHRDNQFAVLDFDIKYLSQACLQNILESEAAQIQTLAK